MGGSGGERTFVDLRYSLWGLETDMSDDWAARKKRFVVGVRYRVLEEFRQGNGEFIKGETLRFERVEWSRYDGSHIYIFRAADGSLKSWWLSDDHEISGAKRRFKRLGLFG
jgi:hypothetical protein